MTEVPGSQVEMMLVTGLLQHLDKQAALIEALSGGLSETVEETIEVLDVPPVLMDGLHSLAENGQLGLPGQPPSTMHDLSTWATTCLARLKDE